MVHVGGATTNQTAEQTVERTLTRDTNNGISRQQSRQQIVENTHLVPDSDGVGAAGHYRPGHLLVTGQRKAEWPV